jgi:hypothetical protein
MSAKQKDATKARLIAGGMDEAAAERAAEILTDAEPGPSRTVREYVERRKAQAEAARNWRAAS